MGLDINAYSKLTFAADQSDDDDRDDDDGVTYLHVHPDFPAQGAGLRTGWYEIGGEQHAFRAGGYGGYNEWRNRLAQMAGYAATPHSRKAGDAPEPRYDVTVWNSAGGPFFELINFSDCEGVIGPTASAKLVADFDAFEPQAKALGDADFLSVYADFRRAFALAADGGAVEFC
jgi:hypothetical protein